MSQHTLNITEDQAKEMPMVDLAFQLLKSVNKTFYYRDLMMEIAKIKGLSEAEISDSIAQLYTEINIDGRFACVGNNVWGLKRWYPVDKSEDSAINAVTRPRIINDDDDDDLDEDESFTEDDTYDFDEKAKSKKSDVDEEDADEEEVEEEVDEDFYEEEEDSELEDEDMDEEVDESEDLADQDEEDQDK